MSKIFIFYDALMKKVFVILLLGITCLLGGCNEFSDNNEILEFTETSTKTEFIAPGYISSEFSDYLQKLSIEELPENASEVIHDNTISTDVKIFEVMPSDFENFDRYMTILWEKEYKKSEWESFFKNYQWGWLSEFSRYTYYIIYEGNKMIAFVPSWTVLFKFWNKDEKGKNPFFMRVEFCYREDKDLPFVTTLYKDFQAIRTWEIADYDIEIEGTIMDWIESPQGDLYVRKDYDFDYWIDYSAFWRIEKNWQDINLVNKNGDLNNFFVDLYDVSESGELLYWKYDFVKVWEDPWGKIIYSLILWDKEIFQKNKLSPLCNDMYCYGDNYTLTAMLDNKGNIFIGKTFWNPMFNKTMEFDEDFSNNTKRYIETRKKLINEFFSLINQKKWKQAYSMLDQVSLSLEEFKQQWEKKDLVHINTLYITKAFFSSFPKIKEDSYLDYTIYHTEIFVKDISWEVQYYELELSTTSDEKVRIISNKPSSIHHNENETIIREYFYLLDDKRFEEAHALQASKEPSVQKLEQMYGNASLDVKYIDSCSLSFSWGEAKMDWITFGFEDGSPERFTLVNVIENNGKIGTYYGIRKVTNWKISVLSTKKVNAEKVYTPIYCWWWLGKPIIYLYPEIETQVKVHLPLQGYFTATYPQISEQNTREVIAQPDGTLTNTTDGKEYSYLFWEGIGKDMFDIKEGFVVKRDDTIEFLQEKLAYLGLTPREYNEFIVYRRPLMMKNEWNLISFIGKEYISQAPLFITPQPDSIQRVFMVFKGLEEAIEIKEQILEPFERSGFSVIEWGGSELF